MIEAMADQAAPKRQSFFSDTKVKIALLIAGFEGLLLLFGRLSRWVVIAIAIPLILLYLISGREMKPGLGKDLLWTIAVSQVLVVAAAILAFFVGILVLILLGIFAAIAFVLIYMDRPGREPPPK